LSDIERLRLLQRGGFVPPSFVEGAEKAQEEQRRRQEQRTGRRPIPPPSKPVEPVAGFPVTPTSPEPTIMKGTLIHEYTQRIEDIDPSAEYYLDETRKRTIKGQYLITLLKQQQQKIKDYPRGTTFVKTPTGYRVIVPSDETIREPSHPIVGGLAILASPEIAVTSLGGPTWQPGQPLYSKESWGVIESSRGRIETRIETGDVLGLIGEVARVPVISAPIAYGVGFGLGLGFRGVGAAAVGTTGLKAKVLGTFATRGPWVAGGTISAVVGADIGMSAAYEEHGLLPKGTTLTKSILYGSQFYAAGLGAIRAATFKKPIIKKELLIRMDEGTVRALGGRKYIEVFGKPLYFGKKWFGLPKSSMIGFEPKPSYPYTPKGLSKAPTIYSQPPVGKPLVPIAFKGTYRFLIPEPIKPITPYEPSPFEISTKVLPKPKLYRSYETYFRVITYTPPSEPIVTLKPKVMKPFKPVHKTVKDIIKPPSKEEIVSGDRVQTILKPPVTKTVTEQVTVPKQLLKPVYRRDQMQMVKPEQQFKGLKKTIQKQRVDTQQRVEQAFGVIALQDQRKMFDRQLAFDRVLRFDTQQIFGQPQMIGQTQAQIQMVKQPSYQDFRQQMVFEVPYEQISYQDFRQQMVFEVPYEQIRQVLPRQPTISKQPTTKPPRVPRKPILPMDDGGQREPREPSDLFARSYLVQTKIRTHYGGRKIKKDKWITREKPLSKMDAMAYGAHLTEHSAKASFRLIPSDRKPQRLSSRIPSWLLMGDQYYNRDNLFVEYSTHRINTPGEINQISRLGWNAPRKKKRRSRRIRFL